MRQDNKQINQDSTSINIKDKYPTQNSINVEDITIVIPTLNEEEAINSVIEDVMTHGYENIIIVDGNSTDRTVEIAKKHGVKILKQNGKGKTGAIITAIQNIKTPYFTLIDGDCTYGAEDIEKLMPYINGKLEVIGVRTHGRDNITRLNRFGNWVINALFNLTFGTKLTDVCSGMYLLQTNFARKLVLESTGFDVEVEIAANAATEGEITETPIGFYQRKGVKKLHPVRDGAKIMSRILLKGYQLRRNRLFYLAAISLIFPGILFSLYSFNLNILNRNLTSYTIGLILIILAVQGFTLLLVDSRLSRLRK
ncbi:glycosyltransferase family 2 protein [Thermoproteota archaeon]